MATAPVVMNPFRRIVNVHWNTAPPVYVTVLVHASIASVGATPAHTAAFTLSAAAITAGCTIELEFYTQASFFGDPQMFKLIVFKVPKPSAGTLFNMTLAGTAHETEDPPPDGFCGHYESGYEVTRLDDIVLDAENAFAVFRETWFWVRPDESDSGSFEIRRFYHPNIPGQIDTIVAETVGSDSSSNDYLSYYDESGHLVNTGRPCDFTPTNRIEILPFDVTVQVNAVKDHTVTNPGYPFDPVDAVRTATGFGDQTCIWQTFLDSHFFPHVSGLGDWSVNFDMGVSLFSNVRTDKIVEVWPSTAGFPLFYNAFGWPKIRLMKPLPNIASPFSASCFPWSDIRNDPDGNFKLWSGLRPTLVNFDPFT